MFSTNFFAAAVASLSLISSSVATYNPTSQQNVVMYYGSGSDQAHLKYYCDQPNVDVIVLGFVNYFPPQANGLVAETFGNMCWPEGNYTGPGYNGVVNPNNDFLYKRCPYLQDDLIYCQANTNKKILLSLGGAVGNYSLNGAADGIYLANFLWGAYGPYNPSWTGVRPLDRGLYNTDTTETIDIDGFDFDIEQLSGDNQAGYIACIKQLRVLFTAYKLANKCSKDYIISGAPQCPTNEPYMSTAITGAKFDMLFIQFYNNPSCSARNYANSKSTGSVNGFNYDAWVSKVNAVGSASAGAKLYVGILGGAAGSVSSPGDYITLPEAKTLITQYHSHAQFGGVMIYEATVAENNGQYYNGIKSILTNVAAAGTVTSSTVCSSSTSSSSSSSKSTSTTKTSSSTSTTSTTSSRSSTTSSTSSTAKSTSTSTTKTSSSTLTTSTTSSRSSTTSSTSSSATSTSKTSSSSSSSTSSSTSSTSTLSSTSSTSSTLSSTSTFSTYVPTSTTSSTSTSETSTSTSETSTSSTSSFTSSSSTLSSTSTFSTYVPTSTTSSTSTSETSTSTTETSTSSTITSTPTPTTVPSVGTCSFIGCYTEATSVRALSGKSIVDYTLMSVEICADFCSGFTYFGLEYSGECYCGNEFGEGSVIAPESECSSACNGTPTELCGAGNRLDVYQCGGSTTSSSSTVTSTTSSETSTSTSESITSTSTSETATETSTSTSETVTSTSSYPTETSTSTSSTETSTSTSSTETATSTSSTETETSTSSTETATSTSSTETATSTSSTETETSTSSTETSTTETATSTSSTETETSTSTSETATITSTSSTETATSTSSTDSLTSTSSSSSSSKSVCTRKTRTRTNNGTVTSTTLSSSTTLPPFTNTTTTSSSGTVTSDTVTLTSSSSTYSVTSTSSGSGTVTSTGTTSTYIPITTSSSTSTTEYTTSTVYATSTYTITSCAATVTDCPGRIGSVTTETIALYTTVCPVTATKTSLPVTTSTYAPITTSSAAGETTEYTTSTVYATSVYTITSCAPTVTNCPARIGSVTTETIALYTTVCPVTASATATSSSPALPGKGGKSSITYPAGEEHSTTTLYSTTTNYKTVKVIKSTATVVPIQSQSSLSSVVVKAPYPTGTETAQGGAKPSGTGVVSASVVVVQKATSVVGVKGVATASSTPATQYTTSGAGRVVGGISLSLAAMIAAMIM